MIREGVVGLWTLDVCALLQVIQDSDLTLARKGMDAPGLGSEGWQESKMTIIEGVCREYPRYDPLRVVGCEPCTDTE